MELLRLVVIAVVLVLLAVRARWAWRQRELAVRVWQAVRPVHVAGSLALLVVVLAVAVALMTWVPVTRVGVGSLVGLDGNAVFAPIDSALQAPVEQVPTTPGGQPAAPGVPWADLALVSTFLLGLCLLFPVLAHAEEVAFRLGWEDYDPVRQVASALRFGAVHLVMLIPVAAALAVSVAGFAYGRIYRRAYCRVPPRPAVPLVGPDGVHHGPPSPVLVLDRNEARRAAVFQATVWHTTFNTTVAVVVWIGYVLSL